MLQIGCEPVIAKKNFKKKFHGKFSDFFFEFFFGQIFFVKFFHEIAERSVAISEFLKFILWNFWEIDGSRSLYKKNDHMMGTLEFVLFWKWHILDFCAGQYVCRLYLSKLEICSHYKVQMYLLVKGLNSRDKQLSNCQVPYKTLWAMSSTCRPRCLYNKVGFQRGFFVSCGSQNKSATRWCSNQVTAVRATNARWHPTAITCTRDGAAPTWPLFAMFQKNLSM
jgi:hypothetical protein